MSDKTHLNLSVDSELVKKAQQAELNISQVAENAIRSKLGKREVEIDETIKICEFCGKSGRKETAEDCKPVVNIKEPIEHPNLLTWLYPDEKWICNNCLRLKVKKVPR